MGLVQIHAPVFRLNCGVRNRYFNSTETPPPRSTVYVPHPPAPTPPRLFECGKFHDDLEDVVVSSPGFPEYWEGQDCHWQLRAREGFQLRLEITAIDLHIR